MSYIDIIRSDVLKKLAASKKEKPITQQGLSNFIEPLDIRQTKFYNEFKQNDPRYTATKDIKISPTGTPIVDLAAPIVAGFLKFKGEQLASRDAEKRAAQQLSQSEIDEQAYQIDLNKIREQIALKSQAEMDQLKAEYELKKQYPEMDSDFTGMSTIILNPETGKRENAIVHFDKNNPNIPPTVQFYGEASPYAGEVTAGVWKKDREITIRMPNGEEIQGTAFYNGLGGTSVKPNIYNPVTGQMEVNDQVQGYSIDQLQAAGATISDNIPQTSMAELQAPVPQTTVQMPSAQPAPQIIRTKDLQNPGELQSVILEEKVKSITDDTKPYLTDAMGAADQIAQANTFLEQLDSGELTTGTLETKILQPIANVAESLGVTTSAKNREWFTGFVDQIALEQRDLLGPGVMTDNDFQILRNIGPSGTNTVEGNKIMINALKKRALGKRRKGEIARFYKSNLGKNPELDLDELMANDEQLAQIRAIDITAGVPDNVLPKSNTQRDVMGGRPALSDIFGGK